MQKAAKEGAKRQKEGYAAPGYCWPAHAYEHMSEIVTITCRTHTHTYTGNGVAMQPPNLPLTHPLMILIDCLHLGLREKCSIHYGANLLFPSHISIIITVLK